MHKRQARVIARGAAFTMAAMAVGPAWCGPVTIEAPEKGDAVAGENIACIAQFQSPDRPITRVEFLVDGHELVPKLYAKPTRSAHVTFVWDATGVPSGSHTLAVRAFAGSGLIGEDEVPVVVSTDSLDLVKPQVHIFSPRPNSSVSGQQDVAIHASDKSGISMVSLFIDKQLKLLQNVPPFVYAWDTTQYANGPHILEVWAFDPAQNKGVAKPVQVFVNNPTGRTEIRDLPDEVPSPSPVKPAAALAWPPAASANPVKPRAIASTRSGPAARRVRPPVAATPVESRVTAARAVKSHPIVAASPVKPRPAAPARVLIAARSKPAAVPLASTHIPAVRLHSNEARSLKAAIVPTPSVVSPAAERPAAAVRLASPAVPTLRSPVHTALVASPKSAALALPEPGVTTQALSAPVRPARPNRTLIARAPEATARPIVVRAPRAHAPRTAPATARPRFTPGDSPTLVASLPEPAPVVLPGFRPSRPSIPAPRSSVRPAPPATRVRVARAEPVPLAGGLGHARTEEPVDVSPAAHRTLIAHAPLRIMLGRDPIAFDVQPVIRQGIAIAPIRQIIEHTGGIVAWIPATRTVEARTGSRSLELRIGSRRALVNHELVLMDRPALLRSGRTMVPVRFLQVALDMEAIYDPNRDMVYLYRK